MLYDVFLISIDGVLRLPVDQVIEALKQARPDIETHVGILTEYTFPGLIDCLNNNGWLRDLPLDFPGSPVILQVRPPRTYVIVGNRLLNTIYRNYDWE